MPTDVSELVEVVVIMQSIGGVRLVIDFVLANGVSPAQTIFRTQYLSNERPV
jgi:hypothetical protein